MRNEEIYNSWSKIKPDAAAHERMLTNILNRPAPGRKLLFTGLKIAVPVAACVAVLLAVFIHRFSIEMPQIDYPPSVAPLPVQEDLTIDQARNCPNFGAFIPIHVPTEFNLDRVWRTIHQDTETLFAFWYNGLHSITWQISNATEHDFARVVDINDRAMFDLSLYTVPWFESVPAGLMQYVMSPVFRAQEITLDAVQARAIEGRSGDVQMNFGVLFGDVIVTINANGLPPYEVWEMILQIGEEIT